MDAQLPRSETELSSELAECASQAWKVYKSLVFAPESLKDVQAAALCVGAAWRSIVEFSHENDISAVDERTIRSHMTRCGAVIDGVNKSLENLRNGRGEVEDVARFSQNLIVQGARITSFYEILRRPTQEHILALLEETRKLNSDQFQQSRVKEWAFVLEELQQLGLPKDVVEEEYFFIHAWLEENHSEARMPEQVELAPLLPILPIQTSGSLSAPRVELLPSGIEEENEVPPEYTPGKRPRTVAEKSQNLDSTTAIIDLNTDIDNFGSSSGASPPTYTFDTESDQEIDEEFTRYIKNAISNEAKRRVYERDLHPERSLYPYSWLPKSMQAQYAERPETLTMLEAKSFTVMGYETAPWCSDEIDRLLPILSVSADGTGNDAILNNGVRTLKTMASAIHKFQNVQNVRRGSDLFSDLDAMDYEFSTAAVLDNGLVFPEHDFELAQKSYYMLLTYVMGMISLMKDIFPGRTYVTRSPKDLVQLWDDRRMSARTAWIEKQVAGWDQIEQSVLKCRDWYQLRPYLRDQALVPLRQWRQAQEILSSSDTQDEMVLTIISASSILKSRLGYPNIVVKLVLYGSNGSQPGPALRKLEVSTQGAKNTQFPIWNKEIPITVPNFPKMLDLEIYDRGIRDKEISRVRLNFSHIPGVERNFAGRSMIFGLDEEISLPLKIIEGKGKETEQPVLLIRLQWEGRYSLLEKSGLIMSAPGKMFRPDFGGIPMPHDKYAELSIREDRNGRSGSNGSEAARELALGVVEAANTTLSVLGSL